MTEPLSAPSPFLPDSQVQFAWDSTSIKYAQECWRRYQYKVLELWETKSPAKAIALDFGILLHAGIEQFHRYQSQGIMHNAAVKAVVKWIIAHPAYAHLPTEEELEQIKQEAADDDEDDGVTLRNSRVRTRYHLIRALVWYFEQYREDSMQVHQLANGKPAVELSFRVPVGLELSTGEPVLLSGHFDKVVRFNDHLWIKDIKSTKSITAAWREEFDLSHQMTGYILGGSLAISEPIKGVVIDGVCLQVGGVKFGRHFTHRTESQLGEYINDLRLLVDQAEAYAAEGYWPMNTSFCRFCEFKGVCKQPPEMRGGYLRQWFRKGEGWNPLKSR